MWTPITSISLVNVERRLDEQDLDPDPIRQFARWLDNAVEAGLLQPYAMTLATATRHGAPSARMLLLRGLDDRGFAFFTSYESQKARELAENPLGALVFYWDALERQVRIMGLVRRASVEESDAYFRSRPIGSRLAAWASRQGEVLGGRHELEERYAELERRYAGGDVPLPTQWGGYRLEPEAIEFWQGRPNRLHDRFLYLRGSAGEWQIRRLSP